MDEVDYKAFDVTTVVILISHNHQVAITERLDIILGVYNIELQAHNLYKVHDLLILHNLGICRVPDVQQFTLQWKHTIKVSADN